MKKLASIFAMLLMVLTLSVSVNSCGSLTMSAAIAKLKSECPKDMGGGMTMTNAEIVGDNAIVTITAPDLPSAAIESAKPNLVQALKSDGVEALIECGPNKVLCGLNRRIDKTLGSANICNEQTLEKALEELA